LNPPRLLIAGCGGDSGKTLATLGLIRTWRRQGIKIVPFKKGPDYIDPAWLTLASGVETHNLDTWMMGREGVLRSFTRYTQSDAINLIEGNRGLHDGEDYKGSHSSALLARLTNTPVVLILPVKKVTRSAAAVVLGMKMLDPEVNVVGVILNLVAGKRHESVVRRAVEEETGIPLLGAIPRRKEDILPNRHLGLVTPEEHKQAERAIEIAGKLVKDFVDVRTIHELAVKTIPFSGIANENTEEGKTGSGCRIGWFCSSAFTFYYPENLESLSSQGCELIKIDPVRDKVLPNIDALYIGGGFPETHAASLADNRGFMDSVADAARNGLPIWAECGGLMFLAGSLRWQERTYAMAGVLPVEVMVHKKPQGHGYQKIVVDKANPFLPVGTEIRGHEFHYSQVTSLEGLETAMKVERGVGIGGGRDGIEKYNTVASYLHVHSVATSEWSRGMIKAARDYRRSNQ